MAANSTRCSHALVLLVGLLACSRAPEPAPAKAANPVASASSAPLVKNESLPELWPLDPRPLGWDSSQTYGYRLKLDSRVTLGARQQQVDFALVADLLLTPVAVGSDSATLHVALRRGAFESRAPGTQREFDELAKRLDRPCFVTFSGGRLSELELARDMDPTVIGVFRSVVAALQFARPQAATGEWNALEYDATGQYLAHYTARASAPNVFDKRKQRYLGVLSVEAQQQKLPPGFAPEVVRSEGMAKLAEDGRPLAVVVEDELLLKALQDPIRSYTRLALDAQPPQRKSALDVARLRSETVRVAAEHTFGASLDRRALDEAKIAGLDFETIAKRLEQLGKTRAAASDSAATEAEKQQRASDEARLFAGLAAMFRARPKTIEQALARVAAKSPATDVFVDALASSGSNAAQDALVRLISESGVDSELKSSIVLSISRTPKPSQASVRALSALLDDGHVGTQALFGLGTFSRLFRKQGDTKTATELTALLLGRLGAAKTESMVSRCLKALSNAADEAALPVVERYMSDDREGVRVDALRALRLLETGRVDELVAARLAADSSSRVLTAALEVAKRRAPSNVVSRALHKLALDSSDTHVRYRAAELMAEWLPARPELRNVLATIARDDAETQVRELAGRAL